MMNELKELVSKGIEGDWRPDNIECADMKSCTNSHVTFTYESTATEILYGADLFVTLPPLSVPDLINDDDFMALIYGKRTVCPVCGAKEGLTPSTRPDVWWCKDSCPGSVKLINRYKYIQQQAIILSGDAQVKYLHKMMMEGE